MVRHISTATLFSKILYFILLSDTLYHDVFLNCDKTLPKRTKKLIRWKIKRITHFTKCVYFYERFSVLRLLIQKSAFERMDIYDDTDAELWSCFIYTILRPPEIVFISPFELKIFRYGIHVIIWCFTVLSFLQCLISCIYHLLNNRLAYNLLDSHYTHINIFYS